MKLNELISATSVISRIGDGNPDVSAISHDSREVVPGALFFAISGFKMDGAKFIEDAVQRGAVAIISDTPPHSSLSVPYVQVKHIRQSLAELSWKLFDNPERKLRLIAVTGTNGKTTIANVLSHILNNCGLSCGVCGTLGIQYGDFQTDSPRTTPEADVFAPHLRKMVDAGFAACVMEATSIGIELQRVHALPFDAAIYTNLSRDHLDFHGSWEAYLQAKLALFRNLPASSIAVINADDEHAIDFIQASAAPVATYAVRKSADYQARNIALAQGGISFDLCCTKDNYHVEAPLIGMFNVYNLAAAFAVAHRLGLESHKILQSLTSVPCVRGRAETVPSSAPFTVVVDYAHTPDALTKILSSIVELKPRSILTVIGAGGDRDRGKRPEMTKAAEQYSDKVFLTSDNPRAEDPHAILSDMASGITDKSKFTIEADRRVAIESALNSAQAGDVVVIAGKGHETYQEIKGQRYPFDDREIAVKWLFQNNLSA